MKTRLKQLSAAGWLAASAVLMPTSSVAGVRICTFPGSPSTMLDRAVAQDAFKAAGVAASYTPNGIGDGDDDGISLKELGRAVGHNCDVIAGFPRSSVADASGSKLLFSQGYLRSGYVSVTLQDQPAQTKVANVVAATYASPAHLIAVQEKGVTLDLENTAELTIDAVANGHAQRAIVWYPAVVAYEQAHPQQHFNVAMTISPYADWHLAFAFGSKDLALQKRIDTALATMVTDGRLATLTEKWALPDGAREAQVSTTTLAYRDGSAKVVNRLQPAMLIGTRASVGVHFIRVSASAPSDAPSFDHAQAMHGKSLYASSCAACHGAQLQGVTAPALIGPAFAPAANSHLTIGGIYGYMASNMPADRPGKMKDQDYADIMAFLLSSNGYRPGTAKLTAVTASASSTPLNAGPAH